MSRIDKNHKNPFLNRVMIRNPDFFFGRSRQVRSIFNRLNTSPPQSVAVVGMRRTGKSSILYHCSFESIKQRYMDEPEKYIFTFLDLQSVRGIDVSGFFKHIGELAKTSLLNMSLPDKFLPDISLPDISDQESFLEFLKKLEEIDMNWIILLDEFEILARNSKFGPDFFSFMRSTATTHNLAFVTSTGTHLEKLCHTREIADSPFFNIFVSVHLGPFSQSTAEDMIERLSESSGIPLKEHAEALVEKAGRLPMYLQMGCAALFDFFIQEGSQKPDWLQVRELFLGEARSHFSYLWRNFSEQERMVLCRLSCKMKADDRSLTHVVRNLSKNGLIDEIKGKKKISSQWFREFISEMAEIDPPRSFEKKGWFGQMIERFSFKKETKDADLQVSDINAKKSSFSLKFGGSKDSEHRKNSEHQVSKLTVMFTDIKGSTSFFEMYGDVEGINMIQRHNELLFPVIEEKKGNIIKTIGDAIMASFNKPVESLRAAVQMQRILSEENKNLPIEKQIHIRIAMNQGNGIMKDGDVFGDVVNTASRMESLADSGQIIISEDLYNEIKDQADLPCRFLTKAKFKGKQKETGIYEVLWKE
ncbi:adenylate/guanylate cyclase domain-containing protein [Desulfobacterales bacterium HSG16]|nr:adenylate/guanylate cyclase domain-containing protein [Desulfobacterales bacterium HSG16]